MEQYLKTLKEHERLDDLQIGGYKLIQDREKFCFGIDAVLLSDFATAKAGDRVIDMGTGTGVIPILLAAKTDAYRIIGVEIQEAMVEMAGRSVALNNLGDRVSIIHGDISTGLEELGKGKWDVVVSNPPYKKRGSGLLNPESGKAIARHEILCTLDDVLKTGAGLLRDRGRFFMIHRPDRLIDILVGMRGVGLEPKRIRLVHPYIGKAPNLLLIEGVLGGRPYLKWMPPLYVYDSKGNYTDEICRIYGRKRDGLDG